jgi:hypothetical protein
MGQEFGGEIGGKEFFDVIRNVLAPAFRKDPVRITLTARPGVPNGATDRPEILDPQVLCIPPVFAGYGFENLKNWTLIRKDDIASVNDMG